MNEKNNRQWRLRKYPEGRVKQSDFEFSSSTIPTPVAGELLIKNQWLAFDPAMRGWIDLSPNYFDPVQIGEVMRGLGVGEVVRSNIDGFSVGELVTGFLGWQDYCLSDGKQLRKLHPQVSPELSLGLMGVTGITAYFGFLDKAKPSENDVVVISGAAGSTGSIVGQIAKIKGCNVIGIAGGEKKCSWLLEKAGFDAAIDYKNEDVDKRLAELCPQGINIFYDNVGWPILDIALKHISLGARVVICGSIARYSSEQLPPGPKNYFNIVNKRARIEGVLVLDYLERSEEAICNLLKWKSKGLICCETDVQKGLENAPQTLIRLYTGENFGKQLLHI
ncbi:MAG: NADP-dependent oxidoreductase [Agarilytica sp.]